VRVTGIILLIPPSGGSVILLGSWNPFGVCRLNLAWLVVELELYTNNYQFAIKKRIIMHFKYKNSKIFQINFVKYLNLGNGETEPYEIGAPIYLT